MNQNDAQGSQSAAGRRPTDDPAGALTSIDPNEVLGMVAGFARENPHAALAGACAIGFLLGGGLTPRLLGGIAMFAGRKYFTQAVRATLTDVFQEQLGARQRP